MSARVEASEADLVDFVFHEARLLDEKRFDEWFALFTDDARYWAPLTRGQPNGDTFPSLFYEDKLLLKLRIEACAVRWRIRSSSPVTRSMYCRRRRWKRRMPLQIAISPGRRSCTWKRSSIASCYWPESSGTK